VEAYQKKKLAGVKGERDAAAVQRTLADLRRVATEGGNVVPPIFEAVKTYASLGEISDVLRGVYGEYTEGG
jgi:methylmalonyl-CoA mutase N-terminal domain/subunit